jgi:hypothetical protein
MEKVRVASVQDSIVNWKPTPSVADQQLAVSNTAVAFAALDPRTHFCILNIQRGDVRVTFDASAPVADSVGCLMPAGTYMYWGADMVRAMRLIRDTGTDAVVWLQECITPATSPAT